MGVLRRFLAHPHRGLARFAALLGSEDKCRVSSRRTLMNERRPSSRPPQATRFRRVTLSVPEDCTDDLRRFARELRTRQRSRPAPEPSRWQAISPSAELLVSPERGARCAVRDTRVPRADRFRWTVTVLGQLDPVAEGRAENRAEARSLAEAAVAAYFADRAEPSADGSACDA
jgi:hypothetical protein